jgi:hypothetical protein
MVKRKEFEQVITPIIASAVMKAQDEIEKRWGFRMEVDIDWHLTKGKLEDDDLLQAGKSKFGG